LSYLRHDKHAFSFGLIANTFTFSFIILGLNTAFKTIKGGSTEFFSITQMPYNTGFLTKYIALSMVFALTLPHIIQLFDELMKIIQRRKHD